MNIKQKALIKSIFIIFFSIISFTATGCKKEPIGLGYNKQSEVKKDDIEQNIKDYEALKKEDAPDENGSDNTSDTESSNNIGKSDTTDDIVPAHLKDAKGILENIKNERAKDIIEINEKVFITQINDIYYNFDDYKDKTIVVEGMYSIFESAISDETMPVVYRNGPGCCNNDGWAGFLLKYDGELPKENDWIRVQGKPELEKTKEGYVNLYLIVDSLDILDTRGKEDVMQ